MVNWLDADAVEGGRERGASDVERAELRELKRRNRLLERESEVLRRVAA